MNRCSCGLSGVRQHFIVKKIAARGDVTVACGVYELMTDRRSHGKPLPKNVMAALFKAELAAAEVEAGLAADEALITSFDAAISRLRLAAYGAGIPVTFPSHPCPSKGATPVPSGTSSGIDREGQVLESAATCKGPAVLAQRPADVSSTERLYMKFTDYAVRHGVGLSTVKSWRRLGLPTNGVRGRGVRIKVKEADAWVEAGGPRLAFFEAGARDARKGRAQ